MNYFRQTIYNKITSKDKKDGDEICADEFNVLNHDILLLERIGSGSVYGEAYKSCTPYNKSTKKCDDGILLSTKKIPMDLVQQFMFPYHKDKKELSSKVNDVYTEIICMQLSKFLLLNKTPITPNLPLYYNYFLCNNCNYINKNILSKKNITKSCILLLNEYANEGDLKHWLQTDRTEIEWVCMYFQVFAGLYTLQKHFDLTHHDLHWGNVLVHKIQPGGHITYKIDDNCYKIPNIGYLFTLWDFGYAYIPGKLQAKKLDYYNKSPNLYTVDYNRIIEATHWNIKPDKDTHKPNGTTPKIIYDDFYNIVKSLHANDIPLCYVFEKMFSYFIQPVVDKDTIDFFIDDDNIPNVPTEYMWLLNTNKNYKHIKIKEIPEPQPEPMETSETTIIHKEPQPERMETSDTIYQQKQERMATSNTIYK